MNPNHVLFAATPKGLEDLLGEELRQLGAEAVRPSRAGVAFKGDLQLAYRVCLWSRMASRVLLNLARFPGETPEDLYQGASTLDWAQHLCPDGTLTVDCTLTSTSLRHSRYAAQKIKDAIVDQFQLRYHQRPSVSHDHPSLRIDLHVHGTEAILSLNLSGTALHRRGYRTNGLTAPLKENVAAALLLRAGWPEAARRGLALLDPLCGSGTLLIEGALIAADGAPGLGRPHYGFLDWLGHEPETWQTLLEEARARYAAGLKHLPPIAGYDIDPNAIAVARTNVTAAGLAGHINVEQQSVGQTVRRHLTGFIVTNPPYGERMGAVKQLEGLYAELGALIKKQEPGSRAAVLTGNAELGLAIGLTPHKRYACHNGALQCQLLCFENVASRSTEQPQPSHLHTPSGALMFANRLRKNLKTLGRWSERENIRCYRLYDADLPEYNLAIDLYHGEKLWIHAQEYAPPTTVNPYKARLRLQDALSVIPDVLNIPPEQLFFKIRRPQKGRAQYQRLTQRGQFHIVPEGPCRFWVNFTDYLDTGLFLDHRPVRALIRYLATGRRFLNLFSYTGTASVHAAAGGATTTTTLDMSAVYLDWAKRNMTLNGHVGIPHRHIKADCVAWLKQQARHPDSEYDLIFLDPPTFSNSKSMSGILDVQRDHIELIRAASALLSREGTLIFSTNYRRFKLNVAAFHTLAVEEMSKALLPKDFARNPNVHQVWRISYRRGIVSSR